MAKVTVTLDDAEQIQLEEVLMDRDEKGAFAFLKRVIRPKIALHLKAHCRPEFEGPSTGLR